MLVIKCKMRGIIFIILIIASNAGYSQTQSLEDWNPSKIKNGYYLTYDDFLNGEVMEVEEHKFSGLLALPGKVEIRTKFKGLDGKTIALTNHHFWGFISNGALYKNANDSGRPMYVYKVTDNGIFYLKNNKGETKFFGSEREELEKYTILYKTASQLLDGLHGSRFAFSCDFDSRLIGLDGANYQVVMTDKKVRPYKIMGITTECNETQALEHYQDTYENLGKKADARSFSAFKATIKNLAYIDSE